MLAVTCRVEYSEPDGVLTHLVSMIYLRDGSSVPSSSLSALKFNVLFLLVRFACD